MSSKNHSVEANLAGAKAAARIMLAEWARWKAAQDSSLKTQSIAKYAAAVTSCKVFIENYLKHVYPNQNVPQKILRDVQAIVNDIDLIEKVSEERLQKIFKDIDQLSKDAA